MGARARDLGYRTIGRRGTITPANLACANAKKSDKFLSASPAMALPGRLMPGVEWTAAEANDNGELMTDD